MERKERMDMKKLFVLLLASLLLASCAREIPADVSVSRAEGSAQEALLSALDKTVSETQDAEDIKENSIPQEENILPSVPENPHGSAFVTGQEKELSFEVQCIGTSDDGDDLDVDILRSIGEKEALLHFYNPEKDCYDEAYFQDRSLIAFRITHGSGSIKDTVEKVVLRADGTVELHVSVFYPEIGTDDMAYRYYLIETEKDYLLNADNPVKLYINGELALSLPGAHTHAYLQNAPETDGLAKQEHGTGAQTFVRRGEASVMQNSSLGDRLSEIIGGLQYEESNLCSCEADLSVDCCYGYSFMLDLEKGFVRHGKLQANLTEAQADELKTLTDAILGDISFGRFSYTEETGHWSADTNGVRLDGFANTEPCTLLKAKDVLARAENDCTIDGENMGIDYDEQADVWRVMFYERATGKRLRVYMTGDGVTLMTRYSW